MTKNMIETKASRSFFVSNRKRILSAAMLKSRDVVLLDALQKPKVSEFGLAEVPEVCDELPCSRTALCPVNAE